MEKKNKKVMQKKINLKYQLQHGMKNLIDLMDHFLYSDIEYLFKKHVENIDNSSIRIYINKIENRITFRIKTGYYLELLTPATMELLESTDKDISKTKYGQKPFLI